MSRPRSNNTLQGKISFTLQDGENRIRHLERFNENTMSNLSALELHSPFDDKTEQLIASVHVDMSYCSQIKERAANLQHQLEVNNFFVPRMKINLPLSDVLILHDQGEKPLYVQGELALYLKEEQTGVLLEICREYQLLVAYVNSPAFSTSGRKMWHVGRHFEYREGSFDARSNFTAVSSALLARLKIPTPKDLGLRCVIEDTDKTGDDLWLPPR